MIRYATVFSFSLICVLLTPFSARAVTIPGGTSLMVRTVDQLSSSDKAGKSFAARLDDNLVVKGRVVIPQAAKFMAVSIHPSRRDERLDSQNSR